MPHPDKASEENSPEVILWNDEENILGVEDPSVLETIVAGVVNAVGNLIIVPAIFPGIPQTCQLIYKIFGDKLEERQKEAKEALFAQKEKDWLPFGYSKKYLDSMKKPEFWEAEYNKIHEYDKKIKELRGKEMK